MRVETILEGNTKGKSLSELIEKLGSVENADEVYALRKRHEEDSGVPMEGDDFGNAENDVAASLFPTVMKRLVEERG